MFEIWPERCACFIKKELKYAGPFGLAAILCGTVWVDRVNTKNAVDTMKSTVKQIKDKRVGTTFSLFIFVYIIVSVPD